MSEQKINQKVDLSDAITILPRVEKKDGKVIARFIEGRLKKTEYGRYEIDETHGLFDGSQVELCLCGTWVKTNIKLSGEKYSAEGLKGLQLAGIMARIRL